MKRFAFISIVWIFFILLVAGCSKSKQDEKLYLFNGKDLSGWVIVLADSTVPSESVWSVSASVIHCTGAPNGYLRTQDSFADYKLHVEWRWPETPTNSGIFIHCQAPDRIWPNTIECQLQSGNAGDFVLIGPNQMTVGDSTYSIQENWLVIPKQHDSNENAEGEWNTYDITVTGEEISCAVNGVLQNEGKNISLLSGSVALQSEGSPIEFRNIWIESLDVPEE